MKKLKPIPHLFVWTAALGVLTPPALFSAEPNLAGQAPHSVPAVQDASLAEAGTLRGKVYNAQGVPLTNVDVAVITADGKAVRSRTTTQGEFAVSGLRGGVYQVVAGHGSQVVRAWADGTAPPTAEQQILIVSDPRVVAGQMEPGTLGYFFQEARYTLANPLVVGGIIAAAVAIPVAIHNMDDDDEPTGS